MKQRTHCTLQKQRNVLHNEILLGDKKEENFTVCDSMNGPGNIMLSEISQSEKDKYHIISLMC